MNKLKKFFVNASIMSFVAVALRVVGVYFSVWLSETIGAEGMGIYSLTSSVYKLGITFASSGIGFAATRIIAEEIEKKNTREALRTAERCIVYSFCIGLATSIFFYTCSDFLGSVFLGDERCVSSIKVMTVSLPFLVMSSVINAYFTGVRNLVKPAFCMVVEQIVRVVSTMLLLRNFDGENLEYGCLSVIFGGVISEIVSFIMSYVFYNKDKKALDRGEIKRTSLGKRVSRIAVPVALSSYIRSGLLTLEHMMIPSGLRRRGVEASRALGLYGVVSGMVFPILFFPSAFLYSSSDLIVPEFAAYHASGDSRGIKRLTNKVMQLTSFFSVGVAGVMLGFSDELGWILYKNRDVGLYLKSLAPLVIVMFFDHVADAILKGLDKQLSVVGYNVIDSVLSVFLVWLLVPKFGIGGYIFVVWFGEVVNCIMSAVSLINTTRVRIRVMNWFVLPTLSVTSSLFIVKKGLLLIHKEVAADGMGLTVAIILSLLLYALIMRIIGCITLNDYRLLSRIFIKPDKK